MENKIKKVTTIIKENKIDTLNLNFTINNPTSAESPKRNDWILKISAFFSSIGFGFLKGITGS